MHEENKFSYRPLAGSKDAEWHFALGLDDVTKAGSYAVRLFHRDLQSLGIATNECDKEHYTFAHLFVSESAATGKQQRVRTIGQTLFLTLCTTGELKVLTRTCEVTPQGAAWKEWTSATAGDLPTPQELDTIADSLDNKFVYKGSGDVDVVSGGYFERTANDVMLNLKKWGDTTGTKRVRHSISAATETQAGVMSATDKVKLNNAEPVTRVQWTAASNINTYTTTGIYLLTGERLNTADGLPITNSNPGHTIHARLLVLDSSISGTGDSQDKCITQVLTLSNRTGGDGDVYIRTGRASVKNQLAAGAGWEPWGKLQQNIEVGQVTSLDTFTDNGIYSGVYTNGNTFFETFVMVVINNYLVAGATGQVRSISQFKYALNVDGTFSYKTRTGQGNSVIEWGSWVDLGAADTTDIQDNSITAQKLSSDVREKVYNPLRPLYIAAGATYNTETGLYSLNGVEDLTEEQISLSYAFKDVVYRLNVPRVLQNISIRALYPHRATAQVSQIFKNIPFNGTGSLGSTKIESFKTVKDINDINNTEMDKMLPCEPNSVWAATFYYCSKLREVWPINTGNVTRMADDTFLGCSSLVELRLYNLKCNLPIQYSPTLSKDSVLYIIKYATPASTITITLHQDAYARLADDADIVAALEAQPFISLVSA